MPRQCIYCSQEGTSKEHVWPKWIRKHAAEVMGIDPANTQKYWGAQEQKGTPPTVHGGRKGGSRLTLTTKRICEPCNNNWMSQLEDDAIPLLTPVIEGKSRQLSVPEQRVLAAWTTKTALSFVYWSEDNGAYTLPVNPRLAHDLYDSRADRSPVPNVLVWVAAYEPLGQFAYRFNTAQGYGNHPVTGEPHQILRVIFIAGHLVVYVRLADSDVGQWLGWRDPLPHFTELRTGAHPGPVRWRRGSIDDHGVSTSFNRHIHGGIYSGQDADQWIGLEE
jgi:hypothetical protein